MKNDIKHKRGIPFPSHIVFSGLALLIQIGFFVFAVRGIAEHYFFVNALCTVMAVITVFYITNSSGKSGYKILWIIFILAVPIFGVTTYMFFGGGRVFPHVKRKMQKCEAKYLSQLDDDTSTHETLRYLSLIHI